MPSWGLRPLMASPKALSSGAAHCSGLTWPPAHADSETTASKTRRLIPPRTAGDERYSVLFLRTARFDAGSARKIAMHARHALDLAFGRETFVKPLFAELLGHLRPGRETLLPARKTPVLRLGVVAREVRAHANHRLDGH